MHSTKGNPSSTGSKISSASVPPTPTPRSKGEILLSPNLRIFSFVELKMATLNFHPDYLLGGGSFGSVFKGWIDESGVGMTIAVRRVKPDCMQQDPKEWLTEIHYQGQFHHPHLVKLIGYCLEPECWILVYEFMHRGSLDYHLFRKSLNFEPLPWNMRMNVALGAAKGLGFLHNAGYPMTCCNFNISNIFLDSKYNAKLSGFWLPKVGAKSIVSTSVTGAFVYLAPEYLSTGGLTTESNVYGFGIVFLELLSGQKALDYNRFVSEKNLVQWAKPYLPNKRKMFCVL